MNYSVALRVEWCKSRARTLRWSEEVDLLQEEMHWVLETLAWEAREWDACGLAGVVPAMSTDCAEGILAYAHRQASIRRRMAGKFTKLWEHVPELVHLEAE